ncbi:Ras association (RalGDS/AF-6) domain [Nesidiocoris tenuis]|uniref:Ras association (RalGDS/AF-6) domain n=1 Tax=Nesidiocoris tenuis TaxID=355587 RepID=A0ABN7BC25_9HEMI|nr:Ras association (RalGDS/AF-6) domain [Nesidiocoris tenuis]
MCSRIAEEALLAAANEEANKPRGPPPLLRSRTLPAIVVPGINILHAQIDSKTSSNAKDEASSVPRFSFTDTNTLGVIGSFGCYPMILRRSPRNPRKHLAHHRLSSPETGGSVKDPLPHGRLSTPTLHKLAKFLNQSPPMDSSKRRLSWESRYPEEEGTLARSSSIDSMVESRHCNPLSRRHPSPLLTTRVPQPTPLSPSVARRMKGQRAANGKSSPLMISNRQLETTAHQSIDPSANLAADETKAVQIWTVSRRHSVLITGLDISGTGFFLTTVA